MTAPLIVTKGDEPPLPPEPAEDDELELSPHASTAQKKTGHRPRTALPMRLDGVGDNRILPSILSAFRLRSGPRKSADPRNDHGVSALDSLARIQTDTVSPKHGC